MARKTKSKSNLKLGAGKSSSKPPMQTQPQAQLPPQLPTSNSTINFTKSDAVPLAVLIFSRIASAIYMIIADCDEVFNYWEPLNLLLRGFGKQTWEYSPEYSIRSWAYLFPYFVFAYPVAQLSVYSDDAAVTSSSDNAATTAASSEAALVAPYFTFYAIRGILAATVLAGEIRLYYTFKYHIHSNLAWVFALFSAIATGMAHGSIALLPSAFALTCNLYATDSVIKYYFDYQRLKKFAAQGIINFQYAFEAIFWYSLAGLLGWPFSLVLAVPLVIYIIYSYTLPTRDANTGATTGAASAAAIVAILKFVIGATIIAGSLLFMIVLADSIMYRKFAIVPLNIFLYNVLFADAESGPNIFGTEPFVYYPLNLALNFNVIFVLSVFGVLTSPVLLIVNQNKGISIKSAKGNSKFKAKSVNLRPGLILLIQAPLAIWCLIFGSQPHKEERFLYPVYPLITLSAAIFLFEVNEFYDLFIVQLKGVAKSKPTQNFFQAIASLANTALIGLTVILSVSRTIKLVLDYSAPLHVYNHIPSNATGNVCIGREWYRFPSSLFLPHQTRAKFVESGFRGLLPGDFPEVATGGKNDKGDGLIEAVSQIPEGMNNKNLYDAGKVVPFEECNYYVDIDENVDIEAGEKKILKRDGNKGINAVPGWNIVYCENFINNDKSYGIERVLYVPKILRQFFDSKVGYHNYCLLEKQEDKN